jgi:hypothetical protein
LQTIQQRRYNGVDQQPAAASSLLGRVMQCCTLHGTSGNDELALQREGMH